MNAIQNPYKIRVFWKSDDYFDDNISKEFPEHALFFPLNMNFFVLHLRVNVGFCCDANVRMTEKTRHVIDILRVLIEQRPAGVTKLVRR